MEVNGILKDLSYEITKDCTVKIITSKDKEGLDVLRHDAAHIMAMAVQELYPGTQVTIIKLLKMVSFMILLEKNHSQKMILNKLKKCLKL